MSVTIRVTPEELKAEAVRINDLINKIIGNYSNIQQIYVAFPAVWEGEAADFNRTSMTELVNTAEQLLTELRKRPVRLLTMAGLYEQTEMQNEELGGALETDVIS